MDVDRVMYQAEAKDEDKAKRLPNIRSRHGLSSCDIP